MSTNSMQSRGCTQPLRTMDDVVRQRHSHGLVLRGERYTSDAPVRRVHSILEDWLDLFSERRVPFNAVLLAMAQDAQSRDVREGYEYLTGEDYRAMAEWTLLYVLNNLTDSGMAVVRIGHAA